MGCIGLQHHTKDIKVAILLLILTTVVSLLHISSHAQVSQAYSRRHHHIEQGLVTLDTYRDLFAARPPPIGINCRGCDFEMLTSLGMCIIGTEIVQYIINSCPRKKGKGLFEIAITLATARVLPKREAPPARKASWYISAKVCDRVCSSSA